MVTREDKLLWIAILAAPLAWFVDLSLSARLVELGFTGPLALVSAGALLAALAAAALALALRGRADGERRRWMADSGLILSVFFALAIVAQALPRLLLQRTDVP